MLIYIIAINRLADEIDNAAYRRGIFWSCPLQVAVALGAIRQVRGTKGGAYFNVGFVMLYERALLERKGSSLSMKRTCYSIVRTSLNPSLAISWSHLWHK